MKENYTKYYSNVTVKINILNKLFPWFKVKCLKLQLPPFTKKIPEMLTGILARCDSSSVSESPTVLGARGHFTAS